MALTVGQVLNIFSYVVVQIPHSLLPWSQDVPTAFFFGYLIFNTTRCTSIKTFIVTISFLFHHLCYVCVCVCVKRRSSTVFSLSPADFLVMCHRPNSQTSQLTVCFLSFNFWHFLFFREFFLGWVCVFSGLAFSHRSHSSGFSLNMPSFTKRKWLYYEAWKRKRSPERMLSYQGHYNRILSGWETIF